VTDLLSQQSFLVLCLLFCACAAVIAAAGTVLARIADELADRTGLGEALFGAAFIGAMTSLPGIITSAATAYEGLAELAFSNAVGGIFAQTAFLSLADLFYRRANLEHAAASSQNLLQASLLIALLVLGLVAHTGPEVAWWGVHPASVVIIVSYFVGLRLVMREQDKPGWRARNTSDTVVDEPKEEGSWDSPLRIRWLQFAALAGVVSVAGYAISQLAVVFVVDHESSESLMGTVFTAVVTSLPELVTAIAAVRIGALTLAVGSIIGGNCFDVLFLAVADMTYRDGSIYHAVGYQPLFVLALCVLMSALVLLGLLYRQREGIANIGFESAGVLVLYALGVGVLVGYG
jgi:cation:H+ antiporter